MEQIEIQNKFSNWLRLRKYNPFDLDDKNTLIQVARSYHTEAIEKKIHPTGNTIYKTIT